MWVKDGYQIIYLTSFSPLLRCSAFGLSGWLIWAGGGSTEGWEGWWRRLKSITAVYETNEWFGRYSGHSLRNTRVKCRRGNLFEMFLTTCGRIISIDWYFSLFPNGKCERFWLIPHDFMFSCAFYYWLMKIRRRRSLVISLLPQFSFHHFLWTNVQHSDGGLEINRSTNRQTRGKSNKSKELNDSNPPSMLNWELVHHYPLPLLDSICSFTARRRSRGLVSAKLN